MKLYYHRFRSFQALCLALSVFLPATGLTSIRVNAATYFQDGSKKAPSENVDSFIIEYVNGKSTCREATPAEVPSTLPRPTDVGVPVERLLPQTKAPVQANAVGGGLTIQFNALSQLQTDPDRDTVIAAFQRAASVWTARIKSPVTITINIDYGVNSPGGSAFGPNTLGSTVSNRTLIDYPGARTNLIAGASSAPGELAIYNQLPTGVVPTDTGNGGVVGVNRSVAMALGIPTNTASQVVATMGFNKNFPFDFNPDDGVSPLLTDFNSVATHEIGHALGFVSGAGQGTTAEVSIWDLFRFRPGTTPGTFTGAQRVLSIGGSQVYYTTQSFLVNGVQTNELELSTGGPSGVTSGGGDGRQSSHWKDDELTGKFIGIMDPSIGPGRHEEVNDNDFAALELLGWNLVNTVAPPAPPPPPPPPANDNFANAQVLSGCSGSVNGSNVGATSEGGEPQHFPPDPASGALGGGHRSVWYRWQSPSTGTVTLTTAGSRFDTVLAVYTGSALGSLTLVNQADDTPTDKTSSLTFNATAGVTYRIAVDGYDNDSGGDFGPLTLNWSEANCTVAAAPQILLEESGPVADQAAVFDSVLWLRDPFLVVNPGNLINPAADPNTRVVIFVTNLSAGAQTTINLVDSGNGSHDITPIDIHELTNFDFTQVTFRLPSGLPAGRCSIKVISQGQTSNTATFRIGP
jgi:hypothetical protein